MKIIDIRDKKIIYSKNLGDHWYWEYKFIVQIDDDNYCLINYDNSQSGWIKFKMECVDEEFVSAFMKDPYSDDFINFDKCDECLGDYIEDYDFDKVKNEDVILISKEKLQVYFDLFESKVDGDKIIIEKDKNKLKEFIDELKYNQSVNFENDLENRIDIDYVIEILEEINNGR